MISNRGPRKEIRTKWEVLSQVNKQMLEESERSGRGVFMMKDNKGGVDYIGFKDTVETLIS